MILLVIRYLPQYRMSSTLVITLREYIFCNHIGIVSVDSPVVHSTLILMRVKEWIGMSLTNWLALVIAGTLCHSRQCRLSVVIDHELSFDILVKRFKFCVLSIRFRLLQHVPVFRHSWYIRSIAIRIRAVFILQIETWLGRLI